MEKLGKIYALCCPLSGEMKYVGKTKGRLNTRKSSHWSEYKYYTRIGYREYKFDWFDELNKLNLRPSIVLLGEYLLAEIDFWEFFWIKCLNADSQLYNTMYTKRKSNKYLS